MGYRELFHGSTAVCKKTSNQMMINKRCNCIKSCGWFKIHQMLLSSASTEMQNDLLSPYPFKIKLIPIILTNIDIFCDFLLQKVF